MASLESERLLFRPHGRDDLDGFCALEANADFRLYVGGAARSREGAERRFHNVYLGKPRGELGLRATVFKPESRYLGYCGIYPHFGPKGPIPGEATLAFYLDPAYWGRGLATEAGAFFTNYGFEDLRLGRIVASAEIGNAASIRVLRKLGFSQTDVEEGPRTFVNFELTPEKRL